MRYQIPAISASSSDGVWFLVGKVFSRSSLLSSTGPVGPSGVLVTVKVVIGVMEESCGSDVLLFVGLEDWYGVGGWTSAWRAISVSLHL